MPNNDRPANQPLTTLHSFHSLFCRRCTRYDCSIHKGTQPLLSSQSLIYKENVYSSKPHDQPVVDKSSYLHDLKTNNKSNLLEPCANDCYLNHLDEFMLENETSQNKGINLRMSRSPRSPSSSKTPRKESKTEEMIVCTPQKTPNRSSRSQLNSSAKKTNGTPCSAIKKPAPNRLG